MIQLLVVVDIADPVAEHAVGPAQAGLHVDDGYADGQVLHGVGRRLVDALRDGVEKLTDFPVALVRIFPRQHIGSDDQYQRQQRYDPIIYGDNNQQQDRNEEKGLLVSS